MGNKKISDLNEDLNVTIADYVPIIVSGSTETKKVRLSRLLALSSGSGSAPHYQGKYPSLAVLQAAVPAGSDGDYAIVTDTAHDQEYIWDSDHSDWVLTQNVPASTFALLGGNATDNASLAAELTARDTAISSEATNRASADTTLQNNIDMNSAAITAEAIARASADTTLQANINTNSTTITAEATARAAADTTLQANIDTNTTAITAEATARATADTTLQANIDTNSTAISNEATARAAADANIQSQVSALSAALVPHPTYTAPAAGISSSQSTSGLEIGQTINIPLTATFTQNDGGASTVLSIKKNGTQIATSSPYTDSGVVMSGSAIAYLVNYSYGQGPVKNNIIGIPDATGRINAGSVNSGTLSYQGFYRVWYDTVATIPTDSATVRALSNTRFSNSGNTFTLNTGSVNTKFVIVLPPGKSLVSVVDQDALNLDITANYVQSSITVNDAAGTPVATYKIYAMSQSVPYSSSHRHNITIA